MIYFIYCQPLWLLTLISVTTIICYAFINAFFKKNFWQNAFNLIVLIISIVVTIYTTVLRRSEGNHQIELTPFYTFFLAQQQTEYYRTFFMNTLLFVPLGLSMPYVLSKNPYKRNVFITIAFAAVLSAGIEFLQYYYHLGRCETDDVIANTLGAAVGTLSYCLYMRILKNQEKGILMQKNIDDNQKLLLQLCAKSLFDKDAIIPDEFDSRELLEESKRQTVFPITYSLIKDKCKSGESRIFSQIIAKNIRVEYGHNEVHQVLSKKNIPYVILKGLASASHYPHPLLRTMGDIDIFVSPNDIKKADVALRSICYITDDDIDGNQKHIGYKRSDGLICELHRVINGIPNNEKSGIVNEYLSNIIDTAVLYSSDNGKCMVPSKFHHGLVILLHTASHLTNEGIGLRHLCDWAVFVNSFSNDEFINTFEKSLNDMGLWRFAQLLTLCCIKYLGCDSKEWAGQADDSLLESIITDILNGGNFGFKDTTRYSHIKYIGDRKKRTIGQKKPILQLFVSLNAKTKSECDFVKKNMALLPIGWVVILCRYIGLVISGKRKLDNFETVNNAVKRKNIYSEFHLFENE